MDLRALFDAFYDRLVLRDLVGKVVPGSMLLMFLIAGVFGPENALAWVNDAPFMLSITLTGFSWLLGFSLQYLGEKSRLLGTHPPGENGEGSREEFYESWVMFQDLAIPSERVHAERINVIREACGNASVSVLLCCLLVPAFVAGNPSFSWAWTPTGLLLGAAGVVALSLWRMHVVHLERYGDLVRNTVRYRQKKVGTSHLTPLPPPAVEDSETST